jgi:hypothetical protein
MAASTSARSGGESRETLIAAPQVAFNDLAGALAALGWDLETQSDGPRLLAGEPEHAAFAHGSGCALQYTFNPVVRLRVLEFRGADAAARREEVARLLPVLGPRELRALLESGEIRSILLGLFAAGEIAAVELVDRAAALALHADPRIAGAATRVRDLLLSGLTSHQGPSSFPELGSPESRRQILRCLLQACRESNATIDRILRSALRDSDPEVRVTAVLAAAKLDAANLLPDLRAVDIPTSTRDGADPRDRLLYERLRQTAIGYLSTGGSASSHGEPQRGQFRDAVRGAIEVKDDATLLLHALTTPLPLGEPPALPPDALEPYGSEWRLRRSGLVLRWVAPVPHWLGDQGGRAPLSPNPIRRVKPAAGFFIAKTVVDCSAANRCWPSAASPSADPFLCTYEDAVGLCGRLAGLEGVQLVLPDADQSEMAARGADGRLYPWGNAVRELAGPAEWTSGRDANGQQIVRGGSLPAARRMAVRAGDPNSRFAVRPVLNLAAGEAETTTRL